MKGTAQPSVRCRAAAILITSYYDTHQTVTLLSTITDNVSTIQDFASSSTLGIHPRRPQGLGVVKSATGLTHRNRTT
jgi:hypothetical protein